MPPEIAPHWREVDIALAGPDAANPYSDVEAWVIFTHTSGRVVRRPMFWDGENTYRVRFASTQPGASGGGAYTPPGRPMTSGLLKAP